MNQFCCLLKSCFSLTFLIANTLFWAIPIFAFGLAHLLPHQSWQNKLKQWADRCAAYWVASNNAYLKNILGLKITCHFAPKLSTTNWYLLICNHQTWVDTVIIQKFFHKKIPLVNFLSKRLGYIPVIGQVWKVLGFPFIDRAKVKTTSRISPKLVSIANLHHPPSLTLWKAQEEK